MQKCDICHQKCKILPLLGAGILFEMWGKKLVQFSEIGFFVMGEAKSVSRPGDDDKVFMWRYASLKILLAHIGGNVVVGVAVEKDNGQMAVCHSLER